MSNINKLSRICAWLYFGAQVWSIAQQPVAQSLCWYASFWAYMLILLLIARHEVDVSGARLKSYRLWVWITGAHTALALVAKASVHTQIWTARDGRALELYVGASLLVLVTAVAFRLELGSPILKGMICLALKAIPAFWLAVMIPKNPSLAPSLVAVVSGLVTIGSRLPLLGNYRQIRSWSLSQIGAAIAEFSNFVSWLSVALVVASQHFLR